MLYLSPATGDAQPAMRAGQLGQIVSQAEGRQPLEGVPWAADNGCFTDRWDAGRWWAWLDSLPRDGCLFATAPDVVGDAAQTLRLALPWLARIRGAGYPVAYVAQDGSDACPPPWGRFDVLFLGGSTDWKLGPVARRLTLDARAYGTPVHMGRVNSERRWRYAAELGCATADGTLLCFGPRENLRRPLAWARLERQSPLWAAERWHPAMTSAERGRQP